MVRRIVMFCFSPLFAVGAMVIPDAWTLCEYKSVELQKVSGAISSFQVPSDKIGYVALEERGWEGDWRAIETIGERCAIAAPTSGWKVTIRLWNRMLCSVLLPMACFAVIFYPLGFVLAALDVRRLKKGLPPRYWQPFYARIRGGARAF